MIQIHNFFELGITAFVDDVRRVFRYIDKDIPAYILNTGDEVYTFDFQKLHKNEEMYERIPRVIFDIDGNINFDNAQRTNPHVLGKINLPINGTTKEKSYFTKFRRLSVDFPAKIQVYVESFLKSLSYTEIISTLFTKDRTFEFMYLGSRYTGIYSFNDLNQNNERYITFGNDTEKRVRTLSFELKLEFQFPALDIYGNNIGYNSSTLNTRDTDGMSTIDAARRILQWEHITSDQNTNVEDKIYIPDPKASVEDFDPNLGDNFIE